MKKNIIISGVTGQDGSYLARYLLSKNYNVYGIIRRTSNNPFDRLDFLKIRKLVKFISLDISEYKQIDTIIRKIRPEIFYNLSAQSFVGYSFDNPLYTDMINNTSVINILESIRVSSPKTRFYQASTSEMYGDVKLSKNKNKKLNEDSKFNPVSPYAISKLSAYYYTKLYRHAYKLFCCNGILFNHESPLRGEEFVTKKIVKGIVEFINQGTTLYLGNIYSMRDWGNAEDYVKMMHKIMKLNKANDFVIATGKNYTIKEFVNMVCKKLNVKIKWRGKGVNEAAFDDRGNAVVKIKKTLFRPHDVNYLLGDASKAKKLLGWKPKTINNLVDEMVNHELYMHSNKNKNA